MRVLYVEDEPKTLTTLRQGLQEEGIDVDIAMSGEEGLSLLSTHTYDIIISDIILPGISGLDFLKKLREEGNRAPVLLLTALGDTAQKIAGLEAGADDYLVKPFDFRELVARLRALTRRSASSQEEGMKLVFYDLELSLDTRTCVRGGKTIDLSPREFLLIAYLIRNKERTISKKEIAEKVWDLHFDTGTNVIEVYVNYLRNKLDRPFSRKLIHTVFGEGYVLK